MYQRRNFGLVPRTFGGMLEDMFQSGLTRVNEEVSAFLVPVNIQETEKAYEMQLVAPGIRKEEVRINVDKNILNISYDHKEESEEQKDGKWLRSEYTTRSFKRSFTLNDKVDVANITAKYTDGVLNVTIAKKENAEVPAKEIVIN